ncbi:hypothetical protein C8R43DRAFT_1023995 [Mycena crocata]|nr:hypothetical protein C8R43DRAFT_1023995 [Mycena crocata]
MPRVDTTPVRRTKRDARQRQSVGGATASSSARTAASSARHSAGESISAPLVKNEPIPTPIPAAESTRPDNKAWRHPDELKYIRSGGKTWDDIAIVRFLRANVFGVPPRSPTTAEPWVLIQCADGTEVTLPRGYRIPLMWVGKYLWTSVKLVLTAHAAIRQREWDSTKFEILHIARLCAELLTKARAQMEDGGAIERSWRCPPFDRAVRRYWYEWLISRDEFVRDFWREFGEEEFQGDVLKLGWGHWVLRGHKGFILTKDEVANGITADQYTEGFTVDEETGRFDWMEALPAASKKKRHGSPKKPLLKKPAVTVEVPPRPVLPVVAPSDPIPRLATPSTTNVVSFRFNPKTFGPTLQKNNVHEQEQVQQSPQETQTATPPVSTPIAPTPPVNNEDMATSPANVETTATPPANVLDVGTPIDVEKQPMTLAATSPITQQPYGDVSLPEDTPKNVSPPLPNDDRSQASKSFELVDTHAPVDEDMITDTPEKPGAAESTPEVVGNSSGTHQATVPIPSSPSVLETATPRDAQTPVGEEMQVDTLAQTAQDTVNRVYPSPEPLEDRVPVAHLLTQRVEPARSAEQEPVAGPEMAQEEESSGEEDEPEEERNIANEPDLQPAQTLRAKQELLDVPLPPAPPNQFDPIEIDLELDEDLELLYPDAPMEEQDQEQPTPSGSVGQMDSQPFLSQRELQSPSSNADTRSTQLSLSPRHSFSRSPSPVPPLSSARFPPAASTSSPTDNTGSMQMTVPTAASTYQRSRYDMDIDMFPFLQSCAMLGEEMRSLRAEVGQLRAELSTPTKELSQRVQALEERALAVPLHAPSPISPAVRMPIRAGSWSHPLQHLISGDDSSMDVDVAPSRAGATPTRYPSADREPLPPRSRKFNNASRGPSA